MWKRAMKFVIRLGMVVGSGAFTWLASWLVQFLMSFLNPGSGFKIDRAANMLAAYTVLFCGILIVAWLAVMFLDSYIDGSLKFVGIFLLFLFCGGVVTGELDAMAAHVCVGTSVSTLTLQIIYTFGAVIWSFGLLCVFDPEEDQES